MLNVLDCGPRASSWRRHCGSTTMGPLTRNLEFRLATPSDLSANASGSYSIEDIAQLPYAQARGLVGTARR